VELRIVAVLRWVQDHLREVPICSEKTDMRAATSLTSEPVRLPELTMESTLLAALRARRSRREFSPRQLEWHHISALLWAGQGTTDPEFQLRTAPSAGALYPLELDAVTASGVFRYSTADHTVLRRSDRDVRIGLARAALNQVCVRNAPCTFAISAVPSRTSAKYGTRATRYIQIEVGHAAQNMLLAACAFGLAGVPVGAFDDERVSSVLELRPDELPLYLLAIGWPRGRIRADEGHFAAVRHRKQ
jgi:SagB-type dehydrogenase family enzyme